MKKIIFLLSFHFFRLIYNHTKCLEQITWHFLLHTVKKKIISITTVNREMCMIFNDENEYTGC